MNREQQRFELAKAYSLKLIEATERGAQEVAEASVFLANKVLAELERTKPKPETPKPAPTKWIPHTPGDPIPCLETAIIDIRDRGGGTYRSLKAGECDFRWWSKTYHNPIVAWKPA